MDLAVVPPGASTPVEVDVREMLAAVARHRRVGADADEDIIRFVRERSADGGPVVLHADLAALAQESYQAVLRWAVRTIQADVAEAREVDPAFEIPPSLSRFRSDLAPVGALPSLADGPREAARAIIEEVDRIHQLNPARADPAPPELPVELPVLSMDPVRLARHVARATKSRTRVDLIGPDGARHRRWADPDGHVYASDPSAGVTFARAAPVPGVLPDRLGHGIDVFGVDRDLGRVQSASWRSGRTPEQAVADELDRRRTRLVSLHAGLPDLLDHAWTVAEAWNRALPDLEAESDALRRTTGALGRLRSALSDQYGAWFRLTSQGPNRPVDARLTATARDIARLENRQKEIEADLARLRERRSGRSAQRAAEWRLEELRALARGETTAPPWDDRRVRAVQAALLAAKPETAEPRYTPEDDRRLIAPDGQVLDLAAPAGHGNGFFGALAEALRHEARRPGLDAMTVAALERRAQRDPHDVVYGTRHLPGGLSLDADALFSPADLERAGVALDRAQGETFSRSGGRLPGDLELNDAQRQALIRAHMYGAEGWNAGTTAAVAGMFARSLRTDIVVVRVDGTFEYVRGADPGSGRVVTLYGRRGSYVAALPTGTAGETAPPVLPAGATAHATPVADAGDPPRPVSPSRADGPAAPQPRPDATDEGESSKVRGLPAGLARTGRFGITGRIGNLNDVAARLEQVLRDAVEQGGHPTQVTELALRRMAETREAIGDHEWGEWLAHGGDEVTVTPPGGRAYHVKVELTLPDEGVHETARVPDPIAPGAGEKWGTAWDPEADLRVASVQDRSVTWSLPIPVMDAASAGTGLTVSGGIAMGAARTRGHGRTRLSIVQGRRTTPTGDAVWFAYPGARLEVTIRPGGSAEAAPVSSGPLDVTVVVPGSQVPWVPRDAYGLPRRPEPMAPIPLPAVRDRDPGVQRRLDDVMWTHGFAPESLDIPERLRQRVLDHLGSRAMEPGSDAWRRLRLFLSERNQLRLHTHQAGPGLPSEEFAVRGGSIGLTLRTTLLSARRLEGTDIEDMTLWTQQRHIDISGSTQSAGTGWDYGPSLGIGYSPLGMNVTPVTLAGGGSVGRNLETDQGTARWQKLTTTGPTVVYELGTLFTVRVRSDLPRLRGEMSEAGTMHVRVPLADVKAFEAALERAWSQAAEPPGSVTQADAALVPPAIRDGRGIGPSYVELHGSAREVREHVLRLIGEAREKRGLPRFTDLQEHYLQRQVAVDFGLDGLTLLGPRMLGRRSAFRTLVLPDGSSARIKITAKRAATLLSTGTRADRTTTLLHAMVHAENTGQALGVSFTYGFLDVSANRDVSRAFKGVIGALGAGFKVRGSRSRVDALSNAALTVAGGWPVIEGSSRWFEYPVDFEISVVVEPPSAEPRGVPKITGPDPFAAGAVPARKTPARLTRRMPANLRACTSTVTGGRVSYWLPEQLLFASQRPEPGTALVEVSDDLSAFVVPESRREHRRPDDVPLDVVGPPELARELSSMLRGTNAFTVTEIAELIDRVIDPERLLALLLRGLDNGATQTELLHAASATGDHRLVVALGVELRTSTSHAPGTVQAGELFVGERTPAVTSGPQRTRGWSVTGKVGVRAGFVYGSKVAPALAVAYGRARTAGTSLVHRADAGRMHIAGSATYDHRFADVVFTLKVEHSRGAVGARRSILHDQRRILVRDGYEFLRLKERPVTGPPPSDVPPTLEPHESMMSGVTLSLRFPAPAADRKPAYNPLVDAVVDLLHAKVPALRNRTREAFASGLPLTVDGRLVQPLDEILSPMSLFAMERRLMSTGLRLTPFGIASDHYILITSVGGGPFGHKESRGDLVIGKYYNPFDWKVESVARSRSLQVSADVPFLPPVGDRVDQNSDDYAYSWNRVRNVSATRTEGASWFDLMLFAPGAQVYEGELRLKVAIKRVVQPAPVIVNRLLGGLPDRVRAAYHQVGDPAVEDFREVTMIKQVAVPDALSAPSSDGRTAAPRPRVRVVPERHGELAGLFTPGRYAAGTRPFPIDPVTVRDRGIVLWTLDDAAVGEMHRRFLDAVRGPQDGRPLLRFTGPALLTEWGTESEEALSDLLSSNYLSGFFGQTLTDEGYRPPSVSRPGGPLTDTHGRITVRARLFNAQATNWVEVSHELESNRRTRQATGAGRTISTGFSLNAGIVLEVKPPDERPGPVVAPSESLGRTTTADALSSVTAQGLVGGGTFLQRPEQRYLNVRSSVAYEITLDSAEQRSAVTYGRQSRTFHFVLDDAVSVLVHPDWLDAVRDAVDLTRVEAPDATAVAVEVAPKIAWTGSSHCQGKTCVEAAVLTLADLD